LSARFIKDDQSVTRSIAGETLIVPVRSGVGDLDSIYTLNEVGTSIWNLLDGTRSVEQVVEEIGDEYEVGREEAAKDVSEFLNLLQAEGRISPSTEGGE
jgi:Coenzyme PQQ synthesis protein D (PqqD)